MANRFRLDSPAKVKLSDYDPAESGKSTREDCDAKMQALSVELAELQEWLYAARQHSVLVVLQGMDTSGKDGTISHVMSSVNPEGCAVASFKIPTPEEAGHDFLWRVHKQTPVKGMLTIFNRSHYEDVLVTRVHGLVDKKTCERRYHHIRGFESLLAESDTIVLKFFLNISKDEQERRLLEREKDDTKAWKLSPGDWHERTYWDKYMAAYEDALGATAAKEAPWYIIPANHKWYRNMVIASTIVDALKVHKDEWKDDLHKMGEVAKAELKKMREGAPS